MAYDKIDIDVRTYDFALRVLDIVDSIPNTHSGNTVARQLARSGTSIGANVEESRSGESRLDFIHKLNIALKESRETHYWLRIVRDKKMVRPAGLSELIQEAEEIKKILGASVRTAKNNKK
ncbi:MAG: four helix bundle protein [Bacteroidota bacterium]